MTSTFNLLDEPWIRVTRLDGSPAEVSLLTLFCEAEDIEGIHGEIASQDVAILRLLVAICHRTMGGPQDLATWRRYWDDPDLLAQQATSYLERYRDRFDLRDPRRPFFQVAQIQGKLSPVSKMVIDTPKDLDRPLFTTRIAEGGQSLSWPEAARWLVHIHAFDPAGLRSGAEGDPRLNSNGTTPSNAAGWAGQLGMVWIQAHHFAHTLLLNVVPSRTVEGFTEDLSLDLAPWEQDAPPSPFCETSASPTGPTYCLTWQTRRVLLHGNDDRVTGLFLGNGTKATPQNRQTVETMTAWVRSANQEKKLKLPVVFMPKEHRVDEAFWRGLPSILPQSSRSEHIAPPTVRFYQLLMSRRIVAHQGVIPLHATGLIYEPADKKSNVKELVDDVLSLPAALLDPENKSLMAVVRDAVEVTDEVATALKNLAGNLDRARGGGPETTPGARNRAGAAFYQVIDEKFPRWLASLDGADPAQARDQWRTRLRTEAERQRDQLAAAAPDTAFAGRGQGKERMDVSQALFFFHRALYKALPPPATSPSADSSGERTPS